MSEPQMDWEALALWLADCHAATTEYDGALKSTSRVRRERLRLICIKAHAAMATGVLAANVRTQADVMQRLRKASTAIPEPDETAA